MICVISLIKTAKSLCDSKLAQNWHSFADDKRMGMCYNCIVQNWARVKTRPFLLAEMLERDTEELEAGAYIIRWTSVLSNRFDTTGFKKVYGDLYKAFTKQTASRRFSISA